MATMNQDGTWTYTAEERARGERNRPPAGCLCDTEQDRRAGHLDIDCPLPADDPPVDLPILSTLMRDALGL